MGCPHKKALKLEKNWGIVSEKMQLGTYSSVHSFLGHVHRMDENHPALVC